MQRRGRACGQGLRTCVRVFKLAPAERSCMCGTGRFATFVLCLSVFCSLIDSCLHALFKHPTSNPTLLTPHTSHHFGRRAAQLAPLELAQETQLHPNNRQHARPCFLPLYVSRLSVHLCVLQVQKSKHQAGVLQVFARRRHVSLLLLIWQQLVLLCLLACSQT